MVPAAGSNTGRLANKVAGAAAEPQRLFAALAAQWPDAHCELHFRSPFELLVATVLSAQSTDQRVNLVMPALMQRYPTPAALAASEATELETLIHSTGFYRAKAKNLRALATRLVEAYGGEVPRTMEDLITLAGVARKTANVVLSNCFGVYAGVIVDTHVIRLAQRLGLSRHDKAEAIEQDLMQEFSPAQWKPLSDRLIWHGRRICHAKRPQCEQCPLVPMCPSAQLGPSTGTAGGTARNTSGATAKPNASARSGGAKSSTASNATSPASSRAKRIASNGAKRPAARDKA